MVDATKVMQRSTVGEGERPKFLLKSKHLVDVKLRDQMLHVTNACLSDPIGVSLHYQSPDGNRYTARSTSQVELGNKSINKVLLQFPRMGMVRAERMLWTLISEENRSANVTRLGAEDYYTANTESQALANSIAFDIGYEAPPFKDISMPSGSAPGVINEGIGFDMHNKQRWLQELGEPSVELNGSNDDSDAASAGDDDADDEVLDENPEIINEASIVYNALANTVLQSDIVRSRSTANAFFYASGDSPWVPFNDSDDPIAIEERALFDEMVQNFNRHVVPSTAPSGFNYFRDAWNYEVGRRYLASVHRKEDTVVIYRKSTKQLQEWFDHLEETRLAAFSETPYTESLKRAMDCELRATRALPAPTVQVTEPLMYPEGDPSNIPAGAPLTLQPEITMLNVGRRASAFGSAPFLVNAHVHPYQGCRLMPEPLSFRAICSKCGREKAHHSASGGFGDKCSETSCARCTLSKEIHERYQTTMGFFCELTVDQGAPVNASVFYDSKLQALALSRRKSG
jgi:hypothetical protein